MKKGQGLTLFVIIGLVLAIAVAMFAFRPTNDISDDFSEFSYMPVEDQVEGCLQETTLDAIEEYGINGSDEKIRTYINRNMLPCMQDFTYYKERGYDITFESPDSSVEINENLIKVELDFPIRLTREGEEKGYEVFYYNMRTISSMATNGGMLKKGTLFVTEDNNVQLFAENDTNIVDANGRPVESMSVKIIDKKFKGLDNTVVLSSVVYDGSPEGALFSPPLRMKIRFEKAGLPQGLDKQTPRLGWYDSAADLWTTYDSMPFEEDEKYYYYSASVDHFTPIALVDCGGLFSNEIKWDMGYLFRHIVEPSYRGYWLPNSGKQLERISIPGKNGLHLLPELMGVAECNIYENMNYKTDYFFKRDEICSKDSLIQDWDIDDDPEKSNKESYGFTIWGIDDQSVLGVVFENSADSGSPSINKLLPGTETAPLIEKCYNECVKEAEIGLKKYFEGLPAGYGFDPTSYPITNKINIFPPSLISGDGIVDGATLRCTSEIDQKSGESYSLDKGSIECERSLLDSLSGAYLHPLQHLDPSLSFMTMEKQDAKNPFYATPMTYGYYTVTDIAPQPDEEVGGDGHFEFEILANGKTCLEKDPELGGIKVAIRSEQGTEISIPAPIMNGDGTTCSSGDECNWLLNEDGKIKSRTNRMTVQVTNKDENQMDKNAEAFAKATLVLIGKMTDYTDKPIGDAVCPADRPYLGGKCDDRQDGETWCSLGSAFVCMSGYSCSGGCLDGCSNGVCEGECGNNIKGTGETCDRNKGFSDDPAKLTYCPDCRYNCLGKGYFEECSSDCTGYDVVTDPESSNYICESSCGASAACDGKSVGGACDIDGVAGDCNSDCMCGADSQTGMKCAWWSETKYYPDKPFGIFSVQDCPANTYCDGEEGYAKCVKNILESVSCSFGDEIKKDFLHGPTSKMQCEEDCIEFVSEDGIPGDPAGMVGIDHSSARCS